MFSKERVPATLNAVGRRGTENCGGVERQYILAFELISFRLRLEMEIGLDNEVTCYNLRPLQELVHCLRLWL